MREKSNPEPSTPYRAVGRTSSNCVASLLTRPGEHPPCERLVKNRTIEPRDNGCHGKRQPYANAAAFQRTRLAATPEKRGAYPTRLAHQLKPVCVLDSRSGNGPILGTRCQMFPAARSPPTPGQMANNSRENNSKSKRRGAKGRTAESRQEKRRLQRRGKGAARSRHRLIHQTHPSTC